MLPVPFSVEIVHHQKAALLQILAQALGLGVGEAPGAHVDGVHKRPIEDIVAVGIHDLFGRPAIDARQAVQSFDELAVAFGIIFRPSAGAVVPAKRGVRAIAADTGVMQAGKGELGPDVALVVTATAARVPPALLQSEHTCAEPQKHQSKQNACAQLHAKPLSAPLLAEYQNRAIISTTKRLHAMRGDSTRVEALAGAQTPRLPRPATRRIGRTAPARQPPRRRKPKKIRADQHHFGA